MTASGIFRKNISEDIAFINRTKEYPIELCSLQKTVLWLLKNIEQQWMGCIFILICV